MNANPLTIWYVANVVISGLILHLATTTPLTKPTSAPNPSPARMPTKMLSDLLIITAATTPAHGTIVPTERSKFPEARQKSIVQEMMPTVETASSSESRLRSVKKSLTVSAQTMTSTARIASMPACSNQLPSCVRIQGGAAAGGVPAARELGRMG